MHRASLIPARIYGRELNSPVRICSLIAAQELLTARSALKQMEELRADLEVERETGKLLVQFLEDAERAARKVPVHAQLLRKQNDTGRTVGSTLVGE